MNRGRDLSESIPFGKDVIVCGGGAQEGAEDGGEFSLMNTQ